MSESFQIGPKANQVKPGLETTTKVFGIVDELAQNFGNELKAAQNKVEAAAKSADRRSEKAGKSESKEAKNSSRNEENQKTAESKHLSESQKQAAENSAAEEGSEEMVAEAGNETTAPVGEDGEMGEVAVEVPQDADMVLGTPDEFIHRIENDDEGEGTEAAAIDTNVGDEVVNIDTTNVQDNHIDEGAGEEALTSAQKVNDNEAEIVVVSAEGESRLEDNLVEDTSRPETVNLGDNGASNLEASPDNTEVVSENDQGIRDLEGATTAEVEIVDTDSGQPVVQEEQASGEIKAQTSGDEVVTEEVVAEIDNESRGEKVTSDAGDTKKVATREEGTVTREVRPEAAKKAELIEARPVKSDDDGEVQLVNTKDSSEKAAPEESSKPGLLKKLSEMITGKKEEARSAHQLQGNSENLEELALDGEKMVASDDGEGIKVASDPHLSSLQQAKLDPDNFHSIRPSQNSLVLNLNKEESAHILKTLSDLAQNARPGEVAPEKISDRLLQGLQTSQPQLAQEVQEQKGTYGSNGKWLDAQNAHESEEAQQNTPSQRTRFEELREKIVRQIKFNLRMAVKGKLGEVNMKLDPPFLGKVKVKIVLETSTAKANFVVENHSVKEVLQRSLPILTNSLAEQGIDVTSVEVNVAQDQNAGDQNGRSFASAEDQQAARDWVASFRTLDEAVGARDTESDAPEVEGDVEGADHIINIMA